MRNYFGPLSETGVERRACPRVPLQWALSIRRQEREEPVISSITENLSSHGFFCLADRPLAAGENVACVIKLPFPRELPASRALYCQAQVVWVRAAEDGRFGIACRIDDYSVA
ncbi:MAG: PilZ domain-containing protein [Bryobacteraceae bacterium]